MPQRTLIPPDVYDIAFGWDVGPEIERLLFACRSAGLEPQSALELGCGTGRLLRGLERRVPDLTGLDLSPAMIDFARGRTRAQLHVADMSDFALDRTFDLVYASANTIRCVLEPAAIARLWRCVAAHVQVGGVFVADLEFGWPELNSPVFWTTARGPTAIRVSWTVVTPPDPATRCCRVQWVFEITDGEPRNCWTEEFPLRTYDAGEFVRIAAADGALAPHGLYLIRDPYLFETPAAQAVGRMLVVLQRV